MRVPVTGASGYIGRAVVEALTSNGHEPVAFVHQSADRVEALGGQNFLRHSTHAPPCASNFR
jgi:uncharacterized protein YbjT (DUF2867 family)